MCSKTLPTHKCSLSVYLFLIDRMLTVSRNPHLHCQQHVTTRKLGLVVLHNLKQLFTYEDIFYVIKKILEANPKVARTLASCSTQTSLLRQKMGPSPHLLYGCA